MIICCDKCKKQFETTDKEYWVSGKTFEGIDKHHNPPEELSRFLKKEWSGEFYNLCRDCHKQLHKEITIILKRYSNKPKLNSDYWLMMNSTPEKVIKASEEIYIYTKEIIGGNKEDESN